MLTLFQVSGYCSPNVSECYKTVANENIGCNISCAGLHADITPTDDNLLDGVVKTDSHKLLALVEKYRNYKSSYAKNIRFDSTRANLSK